MRINLKSWDLLSLIFLLIVQKLTKMLVKFKLLFSVKFRQSLNDINYITSSQMSQTQGHKINEAPFSLINYEAEIQISDNINDYNKAKHAAKKLDPNPSPEDVLNNMIPPRDWKTNEQKYFMQYVSHSKASRDDVFTLKQSLEKALQHRQARTEGICPIRQQLFSQAFDEIIRQVTINCPQRGLLLMRVRDEHKMTMAAYQTLYRSAVEYGMKKQIQSEQGMDELEEELREAQKQFQVFNNRKIELESKKESLIKKIQQRKEIETMENEVQIQTIAIQAQNLKQFLDFIKEEKANNRFP